VGLQLLGSVSVLGGDLWWKHQRQGWQQQVPYQGDTSSTDMHGGGVEGRA
jgi:hypothetical protein